MGVHIEWATIVSLHLIDEDDDVVDDHGSRLNPGNVGLAAGGVVIEGTPAEMREKLAALLTELATLDEDQGDSECTCGDGVGPGCAVHDCTCERDESNPCPVHDHDANEGPYGEDEYPPGPCDQDPDGLHFVGCGCEHF